MASNDESQMMGNGARPPAAFPPLQACQAPGGQTVSGGPLVRHDSSFSPPDAEMVSVMLARPLPPIPEAAAQEGPTDKEARGRPTISPQTSGVPLPTLQTSTDVDHECDVDSEADIHPAFRRRRNNEPLRLFRGASAFLLAAPFNDRRQGDARRSFTHDVQPAPSALDRPVHNELRPPPRLHHYSRSTSDLALLFASDFPPRQTSLMHRIGLPDQPRPNSNALGIYMEDSFTNGTIPNIPSPENLRNRHSTQIPRSTRFYDLTAARYDRNVALTTDRPGAQIPRSTGFYDLTAAGYDRNVALITERAGAVGRSNSSLARRLTHYEGVRQFNRERYQGVGLSRTPPIRPPPPVSRSADQGTAYSLPPQSGESILYPYPWPYDDHPLPRHAYPRVPATPQEEVDAASAQADTDSMNREAAIAQHFQPSAIERIAAVTDTPAPADATRPLSETLPAVVRERTSRDFVDDGERAMRRVSRGVKRVSHPFHRVLTLIIEVIPAKEKGPNLKQTEQRLLT